MRRYDLVEVTWDDATDLDPGWTDKVKPDPAIATSAGYLIYRDESYIILAQDCDAAGEHNGRGQIPIGMVKNIEILKKKD
jgi:hypothetical protein